MNGTRALVLGSGGVTGLAWQVGVLAGLDAAGVDLRSDLLVGTSAGALVGARLASGWSVDGLVGALDRAEVAPGRLGGPAVARLLLAQVAPSHRHALAALGRRAARDWTPAAERRWVGAVAGDLVGRPWPPGLVIVATDAASGRPAFLSSQQPADLAAAVAASCAMPGVFPAVMIDDQLLFDGGLRSPANLDVASSADRVLAIVPLTGSARVRRRPADQAAQLGRAGRNVVLITPGTAGRWAIGLDVLATWRSPHALEAGRSEGARRAAEVLEHWAG